MDHRISNSYQIVSFTTSTSTLFQLLVQLNLDSQIVEFQWEAGGCGALGSTFPKKSTVGFGVTKKFSQ